MTNWALLNVPPLRDEIDRHRRDATFGSHLWFPDGVDTVPARAKLSADEVIEEAEWFLSLDVHPLLIAQSLGMKASRIYRIALDLGREDVRAAFSRYGSSEKLVTAS